MTVKELIKELLEFDFHDNVYIEVVDQKECPLDKYTGISYISEHRGKIKLVPSINLQQEIPK